MALTFELPKQFEAQLAETLKDQYIKAIEEARRDTAYFKEYLTIAEACSLVSVSKNTFTHNFIEAGLPVYKVEQKHYIKKSELNNFISQHRI